MMGQAVEQRSGHFRVSEDRRPFAEVEVGRHDDRGAFVEAADEMEQQLTARLREGEIAEFIEDQEVEAAQLLSIRPPPLPAINSVAGSDSFCLRSREKS